MRIGDGAVRAKNFATHAHLRVYLQHAAHVKAPLLAHTVTLLFTLLLQGGSQVG